MCIQYDLQSIEYFTKILLSWWLGGVNFLESNKNSTGVRHVQKDPLRLGPTSFGPIPELRWQVLDLKMHWFSKCPVLKGNFHLPYFCNHFMYKSFYLWWLLPSLWANKISKKIQSRSIFEAQNQHSWNGAFSQNWQQLKLLWKCSISGIFGFEPRKLT